MAKRSSLRASDADRDRVADRLRDAAAEGRLLANELEDRLATALRARTYGELDEVVDDLPGGPSVAVVQKRPSGLQIAMHHPFAAATILVVCAVAVTAVLMTLVTVAVSGAWLIPVLLFFGLRGGGPKGGRGRSRGGRQRRNGHYQKGGHMHRFGRF